ncbi:MAG: hypothetical protein ACRDDZ_07870 [Marinifilaceae bacterium]
MKKLLFLVLIALGVSCGDDYLIDGGVADPNVYVSTYDFLKSKPLFDTLVIAIDRAGLKDDVNKAGTFYAPTNYCFKNYVDKELTYRRGFDPEAQYSFDSIPVQVLKDSIQMYMFNERLTREDLVKEGEVYTSFIGREFKLSKEPQKVYTGQLVNEVDYLFFINKRGKTFDEYNKDGYGDLNEKERDTRERIQTSGIISTTGVIHVLNNAHVLFFHNPSGN